MRVNFGFISQDLTAAQFKRVAETAECDLSHSDGPFEDLWIAENREYSQQDGDTALYVSGTVEAPDLETAENRARRQAQTMLEEFPEFERFKLEFTTTCSCEEDLD